jgi:hypothetical protein
MKSYLLNLGMVASFIASYGGADGMSRSCYAKERPEVQRLASGDIVSRPESRETLKDVPALNPYVGEYLGKVAYDHSGEDKSHRRSCYVNIGTYKSTLLGQVVDGYYVQIALDTTGDGSVWKSQTMWTIDGGYRSTITTDRCAYPFRGPGMSCLFITNTVDPYPLNVKLARQGNTLIMAETKRIIPPGPLTWNTDFKVFQCVNLQKISDQPTKYEN